MIADLKLDCSAWAAARALRLVSSSLCVISTAIKAQWRAWLESRWAASGQVARNHARARGPAGIFTQAEYNADDEFRKTAAVMKMVINGYAGAGTITMGGYDYHGQGRNTGEVRDLRAGRCMGACLEYAARMGVPLMLYVFSDGSLSANGTVDNTPDGRGKFMWASDNQQTAASFFLVYNPQGRPALFTGDAVPAERHRQIGYFRASGDVETASSPAANQVNLLVETVILNYMALHGEQGQFPTLFPNHGLGSVALRDSLTAFNPIVNGVIT